MICAPRNGVPSMGSSVPVLEDSGFAWMPLAGICLVSARPAELTDVDRPPAFPVFRRHEPNNWTALSVADTQGVERRCGLHRPDAEEHWEDTWFVQECWV